MNLIKNFLNSSAKGGSASGGKSSILNSNRHGFTLTEVLVVVGIAAVAALFVFANLTGRRGRLEIDNTARQMAALLREAQSRSVARDQDSVWGVHFENSTGTPPFYTLFIGSYSATSAVTYHRLPPSVVYNTSTIAAGASAEVVFSKLYGAPSASTSLRVYVVNNQAISSTISVSSSGVVSY